MANTTFFADRMPFFEDTKCWHQIMLSLWWHVSNGTGIR